MDKTYNIYTITNLVTNKKYLGITSDLKKREYRHFYELRRNKHHCIYLQRSFNKHGEQNFVFEVLFGSLSKEKAEKIEKMYLNEHYDNIYNTSKQSGGGDLISYHPNLEGIKAKHSKNGKERWENMSEDEKEAHAERYRGENNPMFGNTHSPEARKKISEAHKGKTFSSERRKQMSEIQNKRYEDPREREKASERNRKRYESEDARRVTGEASKKVWIMRRERGDFDKPKVYTPENDPRFDFVYKGVQYKGWKEAVEKNNTSIKTMRKRMLDDNFPDSYYISEPKEVSEETRQKRSEYRTGTTWDEETKQKMSESGLRIREADYRLYLYEEEIGAFRNMVNVYDFLLEKGMKKSTINNLLRSGDYWKPKKYIHKYLDGLRITKTELNNEL